VGAAVTKKKRKPAARKHEKVWLGEQETSYSCGPASLKYALCILGYSPREEHLRRLARTTWRGTQTTKLLGAARRFGLKPRIQMFFEDQWNEARAWLDGELREGRPVILDVEGYQHYVVAVQSLGGRIVIIDPEGATMDGSDYADVVVANERRLRPWWLSGDEDGEPDAFRGISLEKPGDDDELKRGVPRPTRRRLFFSEDAIRRYQEGRKWVLDEYLVDVVDIVEGVADLPGPPRPLGDVLREVGEAFVAARAAFWHEARAGEIQMTKAHVEDVAVAAEAMDLSVPSSHEATMRVAVDLAALLTAMLKDR
jgi:hypothetical protein